jgi:hypothetical protein
VTTASFITKKTNKANEIGLTFYKLSFDEINMLEGSCNNMHITYILIQNSTLKCILFPQQSYSTFELSIYVVDCFNKRYDVKDGSNTLTIVTSQSRILKLYEIRINDNLLWPSLIWFNLSLQILR